MSRYLTIDDLRRALEVTTDPDARKTLKAAIVALSDPDPLTVINDDDVAWLRPARRTEDLRDEPAEQPHALRALRDRAARVQRRLVTALVGTHPTTRPRR